VETARLPDAEHAQVVFEGIGREVAEALDGARAFDGIGALHAELIGLDTHTARDALAALAA
jgi:hypothetical protein